jgi:hypothetical protein
VEGSPGFIVLTAVSEYVGQWFKGERQWRRELLLSLHIKQRKTKNLRGMAGSLGVSRRGYVVTLGFFVCDLTKRKARTSQRLLGALGCAGFPLKKTLNIS